MPGTINRDNLCRFVGREKSLSKKIEKIDIFIASPGDTEAERAAIRHSIERVNRILALTEGYLLVPIGWEDIPSRKGVRVQEVINPYVEVCDIFIGVLNKRFGKPTRMAESGTEEEYNLIEEQWHKRDPKPEIMFYFKKIDEEEIASADEQLKKVMQFKERIEDSVLYKVFDDTAQLEKEIENALADWVRNAKSKSLTSSSDEKIETLQSVDFEILSLVVEKGDMVAEEVAQVLGGDAQIVTEGIDRLLKFGFVARHDDKIEPSRSVEEFLALSRHLINSKHWKEFLKSSYYNEMINEELETVVNARFKCMPDEQEMAMLLNTARFSPSAANYLLFGDTSLFDNLAERSSKVQGQHDSYASEMARAHLFHQALLQYVNDATNGMTAGVMKEDEMAGQVISIGVSAANLKGLLFKAISKLPMMWMQAKGDIEKGDIVTGSAQVLLQQATILLNMEEFDLAIVKFDKIISSNLDAEIKAAALNNKGLAFLRQDLNDEAIKCFKKSLELCPDLVEPANNLKKAKLQ